VGHGGLVSDPIVQPAPDLIYIKNRSA